MIHEVPMRGTARAQRQNTNLHVRTMPPSAGGTSSSRTHSARAESSRSGRRKDRVQREVSHTNCCRDGPLLQLTVGPLSLWRVHNESVKERDARENLNCGTAKRDVKLGGDCLCWRGRGQIEVDFGKVFPRPTQAIATLEAERCSPVQTCGHSLRHAYGTSAVQRCGSLKARD